MDVEGVTSSGSSGDRKKERERNTRRARGLISCAECRRLKLKCDKQIPCTSCARRGCMSLCPNGVQLSRDDQGTKRPPRPRLVDKERLRTQVVHMGEHIRKLENELRILHSCHSPDIHPLLSEELLRVKASVGSERLTSRRSTSSDVDDRFLESFGTLAVSDGGTERFLGASGTTERLLQSESLQFGVFPQPSSSLAEDYHSNWPLLPELRKHNKIFVQLVKAHLPSRERASELCEAYLENVSWFCRPVRREQIVDELLPALYNDFDSPMDVHDLALILAAFSVGAAGDLTLPPYNEEAELFYELAMMALSMKSILDGEDASLSTVQTFMLCGAHHLFSGRMNSLEPIWKVQSFACVLAFSIGLHRDPANWKLDEKLIQRRRQVFWELFVIDKWKSLSCGRPPSFNLGDIDCLFPDDVDATDDEDGNIVASPWHWKILFSKEVANKVTVKFCSSKPVTYADVLELDRVIEDFSDCVIIPSPESVTQTYRTQRSADVLRHVALLLFRNIALIHVHRGFFAEALMTFPLNPLDSPFAHSFSAAYRGSVRLLGILRTRFDELSHLLIRMWSMWAHSLTAAVVVGSVALHCRGSSMAAGAAIELDHAITLFEKAIIHPVVETGLPILLRLRNRARDEPRYDLNAFRRHESASAKHHNKLYTTDATSNEGSRYQDGANASDDEHELSILRGTGDLISVSSSNKPPKRNQKLKETPSVPTGEQRNKFPVDPFGLLQYGGLSQSQFAPGGGQEHLEDARPVSKEGSPFDDVDIMPEAAVGLAEYISQSTQPEDSWQSFMQALGVGDMHSML